MRSIVTNSRDFLQRGFTLVELLIVVIILAILAAIVIPQFTGATVDAQESALDTDLNALRSAIDLYRVQHNNVFPGTNAATGATCTGGTAGVGAVGTAAAMIEQLTMFTTVTGGACNLQVVAQGVTFGPYLRRGFPAEPVSQSAAVALSATATPLAPAAVAAGWAYSSVTGQIVKNSNGTDSRGVVYSTH